MKVASLSPNHLKHIISVLQYISQALKEGNDSILYAIRMLYLNLVNFNVKAAVINCTEFKLVEL